MFKKLLQNRHAHPYLHVGGGVTFLLIATVLVSKHITTISTVRDVSVPIVAKLPQLERRLDVLKQQVEISQLHSATKTGSQQEKVEVYALPEQTDVSRLIAFFEVLRDVLERRGHLSHMSDVTISDAQESDVGGLAQTLSVEFVVHEDGVKTIMLLTRLAGLLTVGDVLTDDQRTLLLHRIEQENPAGIIALEQFLSVDLMWYIEEPKTFEQQLKKSFSSDILRTTFDHVVRTSLLYDAKIVLGSDLGEVLRSYKLWPLQMMVLQEASLKAGSAPGWHRLGLTVLVFSA